MIDFQLIYFKDSAVIIFIIITPFWDLLDILVIRLFLTQFNLLTFCFTFLQVFAVYLAWRYRNQHDPWDLPPRAVFPRRNYLYWMQEETIWVSSEYILNRHIGSSIFIWEQRKRLLESSTKEYLIGAQIEFKILSLCVSTHNSSCYHLKMDYYYSLQFFTCILIVNGKNISKNIVS